MKTAIVQCADTGPLESIAVMLRSVGYEPLIPSRKLKFVLRELGCDTVLDIEDLVRSWGYDKPMELGVAELSDMDTTSLFVDIKAHRSYDKLVRRWPRLENRILWYRINGGEPEHVVNERGDHGNEIDPPCPILTPNRWYSYPGKPWSDKAYSCWPPFVRAAGYDFPRITGYMEGRYDNPICLIHNVEGWGYQKLIPGVRELGVRCYGVRSPDGLINHREIPVRLTKTLAMVHLKSNDAPGYALYEALAAGCPVICTRRLIWRCRMHELLIPDKTCLVFDRETHEGLTDTDVRNCLNEIRDHLDRLFNPLDNRRIGEAGREQLRKVMWKKTDPEDVESLSRFMERFER